MPSSLTPPVDVVIATRDRPEMLARAVRAALGQRYDGPLAVHVVTDQSELDPALADEFAAAAAASPAPRAVTISPNERTAGLPGARNTGLARATGDFVAFCDDDDEWLPDKTARQVAALQTDGGALCSAGGFTVRTPSGDHARLAPDGAVGHDQLLAERVTALHPSTFVFDRARLAAEVGDVDEEIPGGYGEDYDLLLRVSERAPVLSLPGPLAIVYWHPTSFFADRWRSIAAAHEYLRHKHAGFAADPRAAAWLDGKAAFAYAAVGERRRARRLALSALRRRPGQRQAWAALAVATGAVSASRVQAAAQRLGRGI